MRSASSRKKQRPGRSETARFSSFLWITPSASEQARQARTPFSKVHDLPLRRTETRKERVDLPLLRRRGLGDLPGELLGDHGHLFPKERSGERRRTKAL